MDEIIENILRINCLSYNKQCEYVKNKLLSLDPLDITHAVFFKKLLVILQKLPKRLEKLNLIIGEGDETFF